VDIIDFVRHLSLASFALALKAAVAGPAIIDSAANFAPGFVWQEHSIVSGNFD
jgi:hypothetical protein